MSKQYAWRVRGRVKEVVAEKKAEVRLFDEPKPYYLSKVNWIDRLLAATLLPLLPSALTPNQLTVARFVLVPIVCFLILTDQFLAGFIFFIIAALTDALDGALARTRNQITDWGIIYDPVADKLLITSLALILITRYLNLILAVIIILVELALVLLAYLRFRGKLVPAKTVGKIKMILECVGVGFILLYTVSPQVIFLTVATYLLYLAILFALLSLSIYRSI